MPKYLTVSSNGILLFVDHDIIWNCLQFFRTLLLHLTTGGRKSILSHLLTLILRRQSVEYFQSSQTLVEDCGLFLQYCKGNGVVVLRKQIVNI